MLLKCNLRNLKFINSEIEKKTETEQGDFTRTARTFERGRQCSSSSKSTLETSEDTRTIRFDWWDSGFWRGFLCMIFLILPALSGGSILLVTPILNTTVRFYTTVSNLSLVLAVCFVSTCPSAPSPSSVCPGPASGSSSLGPSVVASW